MMNANFYHYCMDRACRYRLSRAAERSLISLTRPASLSTYQSRSCTLPSHAATSTIVTVCDPVKSYPRTKREQSSQQQAPQRHNMSSSFQRTWNDNDLETSESLLRNSGVHGSNGNARRRTSYIGETHHRDPFVTNTNAANTTQFSPPPTSQSKLPLYAHNGGYGPVRPDEWMEDTKKSSSSSSSPAASLVKLAQQCRDCLQYCGCTNHEMISTEGPDGDFYRDDFNDQPDAFVIGTSEDSGIWMNQSDTAGTIMAFMVWVLLSYSAVTITFLAETGGVQCSLAMLYVFFCCLALASHAKTTFSDPGTVPSSAQPNEALRLQTTMESPLSMCSQCCAFKPPFSHHCRICNRCISRMDHHCPWMNNCVGVGNFKHFILFLTYTWLCATMSLALLGYNYFFCVSDECMYSSVLIFLTRIMTLLSIAAFLFTSSMLMNVTYGIMTGIGTIDRLKKKATDTMDTSEEEPIPLKEIFGIAGYHTWWIPVDPVFEDYDRVMGFSTAQRLLREQVKAKEQYDISSNQSVVSYSTTQ